MPGLEALFDGLIAIVIAALVVIRIRASRARRDIPVGVAIATGVVLGIVFAIVATAIVVNLLPGEVSVTIEAH